MSARLALIALSLAWLGCALPGTEWLDRASPKPDQARASNAREARRMEAAVALIAQVNLAREREGVETLQPKAGLIAVAGRRASDMIAEGYFDHVDPLSGTVEAERLMREQGYTGTMGEVLFASTASLADLPDEAVSAWLDSQENRSTLLDEAYRYTGAAVVDEGSWWYVVQVFAGRAP